MISLTLNNECQRVRLKWLQSITVQIQNVVAACCSARVRVAKCATRKQQLTRAPVKLWPCRRHASCCPMLASTLAHPAACGMASSECVTPCGTESYRCLDQNKNHLLQENVQACEAEVTPKFSSHNPDCCCMVSLKKGEQNNYKKCDAKKKWFVAMDCE